METINNIISDEGGYQSEVYLCTAGKLTWLIGRNIEDRPITPHESAKLKSMLIEGRTMEEWALWIFRKDITSFRLDLTVRYGVDFSRFNNQVEVIILNMAFNMGTNRFNPVKWPKFFHALEVGNWTVAAAEMQNSLWYSQVKSRAVRLVNSMLNI
jgi:GH24 family phage-related lysozyme (muramidase)